MTRQFFSPAVALFKTQGSERLDEFLRGDLMLCSVSFVFQDVRCQYVQSKYFCMSEVQSCSSSMSQLLNSVHICCSFEIWQADMSI